MELKREDYSNLYEKANKEQDEIRKIIKLHILDTVLGTEREDLIYVDVCYPSLEKLFNVIHLDPINEKLVLPSSEDLKNHFEQNYDYSYEQFNKTLKKTIDVCKKINNKDKMIGIAREFEEAAAIVYSNKKSLDNVIDMNINSNESSNITRKAA